MALKSEGLEYFIQLGQVDELGSGVLNLHKYINAYAGSGKPQIVEGPVFKMIIPLTEGASGGVIEGVIEGVNDTVGDTINDTVGSDAFSGVSESVEARLLIICRLNRQPKLKVADLMSEFDVTDRTIREDLKRLSDQNIIIYQGSRKTGGYILNLKLHDKLHDKQPWLHDKSHHKIEKMTEASIISKVWNFASVLRYDGVIYGDYLEQI